MFTYRHWNVATNPLERMRENLLNSSTRFHGQICEIVFFFSLFIFQIQIAQGESEKILKQGQCAKCDAIINWFIEIGKE